jgi:hypothetical protein
MFDTCLDSLEELYHPYLESTGNLVLVIIEKYPKKEIKEEACSFLTKVISAVIDEKNDIDLA